MQLILELIACLGIIVSVAIMQFSESNRLDKELQRLNKKKLIGGKIK